MRVLLQLVGVNGGWGDEVMDLLWLAFVVSFFVVSVLIVNGIVRLKVEK